MIQSTIDEQVALLMQGTEYGDIALASAMEAELRERLEEAIAKAARCESIADLIRVLPIFISGIWFRFARCVSSKSLGMKSLF